MEASCLPMHGAGHFIVLCGKCPAYVPTASSLGFNIVKMRRIIKIKSSYSIGLSTPLMQSALLTFLLVWPAPHPGVFSPHPGFIRSCG